MVSGKALSGVLILLFALVGTSRTAHAQTLFVRGDAPLGGDGNSWDTPFRYLQDALDEASSEPTITEIRVAGGFYTPDQDERENVTLGDRSATFTLLNGVSVRGGYAGFGPDPDERNTELYESILSGELGLGNNSYHIVTASGANNTAGLDGFTIRDGLADGGTPNNVGAGL